MLMCCFKEMAVVYFWVQMYSLGFHYFTSVFFYSFNIVFFHKIIDVLYLLAHLGEPMQS
jgi:hypothetical protein